MVQFSFYDMKYIGEAKIWWDCKIISDVFTRDDCFNALKLSLVSIWLVRIVQLAHGTAVCQRFSALTRQKAEVSSAAHCTSRAWSGGHCRRALSSSIFYTHGFVLDSILGLLGIPEDMLPFWLKDTRINNWVLVASSIWRYMGQNMVLFIGAIASVDKTQYEAAAIDGANAWHRFRYIILPSIRTIVVLNMILAISGSLSVFEIPYVITDGGFGTSTYFVLMDKLAHANQKVGLASAMAVVLLVLILVVSGIQKLAEKKMNSGVRSRKEEGEKMKQQKRFSEKTAKADPAVCHPSVRRILCAGSHCQLRDYRIQDR